MNRFVPGILMAGLCLLILLSGSLLLIKLFILLVAIIAQKELFRMIYPDIKGFYYYLTFLVTFFPMFGAFSGSAEYVTAGLVLSFIGLSLISFRLIGSLETVFTYLVSCCFATFYIPVLLSFLILVACFEQGNYWLLILMAIIAGADTGAYYFGKNFGRKKLLPAVSPKKTIVGSFGGLLTGTSTAVLISLFLPVTTYFPAFISAVSAIVIIGMVGDLIESTIKRSCSIKDSGTLLGGHGGVLDRIDSVLPAAPFLYYFLSWGIL